MEIQPIGGYRCLVDTGEKEKDSCLYRVCQYCFKQACGIHDRFWKVGEAWLSQAELIRSGLLVFIFISIATHLEIPALFILTSMFNGM